MELVIGCFELMYVSRLTVISCQTSQLELQSLRVWESTLSKCFIFSSDTNSKNDSPTSLMFSFWQPFRTFLLSRAYLDCHLMVTNPIDYVEPLAKAGASGFTFHVEVSKGGALLSVLIFWSLNVQNNGTLPLIIMILLLIGDTCILIGFYLRLIMMN